MIHQKIKHSNQIEEAGYDPETKVLHVTFTRGSKYAYFDVPVGVYTGLVTAHKAGSFFAEKIKNVFKFKKL